MARLVAATLVSVVAGLGLASQAFVPRAPMRGMPALLLTSLATGMGLGVSACAFFVWVAFFGPSGLRFAAAEVLVVGLVAAVAWRRLRRPAPSPSPGPADPLGWGWRAAVSVSIAVSAAFCVVRSVSLPHGFWDAWMTWNVAARFLFRGESHWRDAFSSSFRHPDYPLLVPAAVARLWSYMGTDSVIAPVTVALLFTAATVGVAGAGLAILRTRRQAILGVLVLLATPSFLAYGAAQYADVPLGFFVLSTLVLIFLHDHTGEDRRLMVLAGVAAGFAAWTKNEGVLFFIAIVVARTVAVSAWRGWTTCMSELARFGAGAAPVLAVVAYFKLRLAPANDLMAGQGVVETLSRLFDVDRYAAVARVFASEIWRLGHNGLVGAVPLLIVYLLCVGLRSDAGDRRALATSLGAMVLMLAGYVMALVTAPDDFLRLLNRSVDRLLLHVWPLIVFTCFMMARAPEDAE